MSKKITVLIDGGHLRIYLRRAHKPVTADYIEKVGLARALATEEMIRILYYDCALFNGTTKLPISRAIQTHSHATPLSLCLPGRGWTNGGQSCSVGWVKPTETDPGKREQSGQPDWQRENEKLRLENERLRQEIERLREQLEQSLRAGKRQAAPFSRGEPKRKPKPPGRKPGHRYGKHERRKRPAQVDETIAVPLPAQCECGGAVEWERDEAQYQEDIVVETVRRRFDIAIGHCQGCGQRLQGRDPRQTSDALGAASVQIGPTALSLAALMNKQMGVSLGNTQRILELGCGLKVSRGGLSRALARVAAKAEPTYQQLLHQARQSLVNAMDET